MIFIFKLVKSAKNVEKDMVEMVVPQTLFIYKVRLLYCTCKAIVHEEMIRKWIQRGSDRVLGNMEAGVLVQIV